MKKSPAIRFLLEVYSSAFDRNGNREHWARITSTLTGNTATVLDVSAQGNVRARLGTACESYGIDRYAPTVTTIEVADIPIREWKASRPSPKLSISESDITGELLAGLDEAP